MPVVMLCDKEICVHRIVKMAQTIQEFIIDS